MRMTKPCYQKLISLPAVPPERGGLLGGHGGIVDTLYLDEGKPVFSRAVYIPSLNLLNRQLVCWQEKGINFMGMFHSHPAGEPGLSGEDKVYIRRILEAMPDDISGLFFPVVLPGEKIVSFYAERTKNDRVDIITDALILLEPGES